MIVAEKSDFSLFIIKKLSYSMQMKLYVCKLFRPILWFKSCIYVCIGFKKFFCVVRHLDSIASYLPTGLHLGFFRSWPSLFIFYYLFKSYINYLFKSYINKMPHEFSTEYICIFNMIFIINNLWYPKQHQHLGLCNRDYLWG